MAILNDYGDAGVYRVEQLAQQIAAGLGVQKEVLYGFFNENGRFPRDTAELNAWGNQVTKYGVSRRDPQTGAWHPIMPGVNPDPRLTAQDRGGFPHTITNAEDSQIERFKEFYPSILTDPAPTLTAPATQQIQGGRLASAFDANNYVAPSPVGFVSVVNGVPNQFATQAEAENDYNARTGGGSSQGAPPAGPSVGAPGPGSAGPGASPATGGTAPGSLFNPSAASAANAAVLAFLEQRRIDEIEKPELALKTQTELAQMRRDDALAVWKQAYEAATLTGNLNGTPTLDATKQQADLTGYTGQGYATRAQAAYAGLAPAQRNAANAAAIWQQIVPGLTADEAAAMDAAGHQYYATTHQVMPDDVAAQNLARITGGRITGTGSQPTAAYQHQQNQDALSALTLLSNLRGPENAFAYANTLANLPDSVRQAIAAAQQNLPTAYGPRNPAQAGLLGDATGRTGLGQAQTQLGGNAAVASPQVGAGLPVATGPRTTMTPDLVAVQPGATQQTQSYLRMDPATQAAIGATTGTPGGAELSGGPVAARPILTAGPGVGGDARTLPTPGGSDFGMPAGGVAGGPRTLPSPRGSDFGGTTPVYGGAPPVAYGPRTQPAGLPLANQISPTDWNATNAYAQKLMLAAYENQGQDKEAVMDAYTKSLPRAYGPRTGRLRAA